MKILVLYGKFGMGHKQAAESIYHKICACGDGHEVHCVDFFDYTGKGELVYKAFDLIVRHGESLFNWVYTASNMGGNHFGLPFKNYCFWAFQRLLDEHRPDMIISTLPFTSQLAGRYKAKIGGEYSLIICATDIDVHNDWIAPCADAYLVPAEETRAQIIAAGVPKGNIFVTGVPIREEFYAQSGQRRDKSDKNRRQLLIMGGGLGLICEDMDFYQSLNQTPGLETTVICAGNQKLYAALHGRFENVNALGFVTDMASYMRGSDLLLGKPGGITMFEAVASGLPFLSLRPFLPQEGANAAFIQSSGIGRVLAGEPESSLEDIRSLIFDDAALADMGRNMARLESSFDKDAVLRLCSRLLVRQAS